MKFTLIPIVLIVILFFPIPIKLEMYYIKNSFHLYIYGKKIVYKRRVTKKVEHEAKDKDYIGRVERYYKIVRVICSKLKRNSFKPRLTFKFKLEFGLSDAAATSIFYGVLNAFSSYIYNFLHSFFKVKKYDFKVLPDYNDPKIELKIKSIIWISIVNTLYIVILILLGYREGKRLKEESKEESA